MLRDAPAPGHGASFAPPTTAAPNYLQMLWQRKLLLVLGTIAGAGIGFWISSRQPSVYRSSARFQLVEPYTKHMPVEGVEAPRFGDGDEQAMIMRSERVLTKAAELGKLEEVPPFLGMPASHIGSALSASSAFTTRPLGTTIYEIGYASNSPETPQHVLQAVTDAYAEHLAEQQNMVGKETLALIDEARGEVLERLEKLEQEFDKFKRSTPLVHRNGEMSSIHREYADRYLSQRQELVVRRTQIASKLQAAQEAFAQGETTQSILLLLAGDGSVAEAMSDIGQRSNELGIPFEKNQAASDQEMLVSSPTRSRADIARMDTLFPLEIQEQELLREVGGSHPSVLGIRSKIRMIEAQIKLIEKSEKEYNRKVEEFARRQAEQDDIALDLNVSPEEREKMLEARREAKRKEQARLLVLAMEQQTKLIDHEIEVITEAYNHETDAMSDERAAEIEHDRLTREIARQQSLYDRIVERLDEISITAESAGVRIVPLETPKLGSKVTTMQSRAVFTGAFLGFGSMIALSLLLGVSDKSYHSAEQIAEHLKSPVIGHIPFIPKSRFRSKLAPIEGSNLDSGIHAYHHPKNSASEAYKSIRTALFFSNQGGEHRLLQVTSAAPGEGKTTVASNIAITIAQSGKSVLLLDADLRRPRIQKLFTDESERGLAWAVETIANSGEEEPGFDLIAESIRETEVDNVSILGAGSKPDNPAELLSSKSFDTLLKLVRDKFDMVILDSPPLLAVTDPSNIAPRVDGVIMVVRLGKENRPRAAQAIRMLETLNADVIGVVVNGVGGKHAGYYGRYGGRDGYYNSRYYRDGYGYSYGYGGERRYGEYYDDDEPKTKQKVAPTTEQQP